MIKDLPTMRCLGFVLLAFFLGCDGGPERPVVRFLIGPDVHGAWRDVVSRFEAAHPDIDVEMVEGPTATNSREEMYTTGFLSGKTAYDLVFMDVIWVPKFAAQGWLQPLDSLFSPSERQKFLPGDIQGSVYGGKIYRVPIQSDAGVLYYRKDILKQPPATFEELVAAAKRHQKPSDLWGFVFQGQQYEGLVCAFLEILWGHGGEVLNEKGEVVLDSPEAIRALEWMKDLIGTISPEAVTTYEEEEARHDFQDGRSLLMRNWPYAWQLCQQEGSAVRGKVGITPMVHVSGKSGAATLGGWGFGISSQARYPEAAWKFIEFVSQPTQLKVLHLTTGLIPARKELFEDADVLKANPHYSELYKVLIAARPRPVHPHYAKISDVLRSRVSSVLAGRETPEQAIKAAADKLRSILKART